MANIAKLNIGEVLQNRKTGEVLTVKELTDTVAVLSNNKGYKLTAILKTYKRATEVITNVNISEAAMEANMQKATATATTTTNTANTVNAVITVQSEAIKEFESKQNFVIKAYNNKKATATATATAKTTAKTTATATANLTAVRDEVLSIAGEHFTLQQKTTYISVKFGNKCVMEVYNGKRAFSIAVSNKYLTAEQIALAKVTTQPFPNNCYFKVNSNNYSTILAIVKSAIANIVTTLNATAKATATTEQ